MRVSEEAIRTGAGVAMYQGKLVGPPIRKKAEKVLAVMDLVKQKEMLCE